MALRIGLCLIVILCGVAAASEAGAATPEPLRIPYVQATAVFWDIDVAFDEGFFAAEGFAPEAIANQGSVQSIQLMIAGGAELTVSQSEAALAALMRGGEDFAVIAAPADCPDWYMMARPEIKDWGDLKGKFLGFSTFNTAEYWMTVKLLAEHGLAAGNYSPVEVVTSAPRLAALERGSIVAAVLYQPTGQQAAAMGDTVLHRFAAGRRFPPFLYSVGRHWAALDRHGQRVSRALLRAHQWLYDPANRQEAVAILARHTKRDPAILQPVYDVYVGPGGVLSRDAAVEMAGLRGVIELMTQNGAVPKGTTPSPERYLLPSELGGLHR